jgi:hypothetical protein
LESENRNQQELIQELQGQKSMIEKSLHAFHEAEGASKNTRLNLEDANFDLQQTLRRLQQQLADAERTIQQLSAEKDQRPPPRSISEPPPRQPQTSSFSRQPPPQQQPPSSDVRKQWNEKTRSWDIVSGTENSRSSNISQPSTSSKSRFESFNQDGGGWGSKSGQSGQEKKKSANDGWWGIDNESGRRRPGNPDGAFKNVDGNFMSDPGTGNRWSLSNDL